MKRILTVCMTAMIMLALSSCNEEDEREQLRSEVDEVHNEAMAKMGTLVRLQKQLTQVADSLRSDSLKNNAERVDEVETVITELREADENMMAWMHRYSEALSDSIPHEEEMALLEKEKQNMEDVHEQMKSAIAKAESILKNR